MPAQQKKFLLEPEWLAAGSITAIIACLHLYFLFHAGGLWRDEVNLINLAGRHSISDMAKDSFPVLMPLLVKGWMAIGLGQSDLSLRLLGTLVGLGIIAAFWIATWVTRRPPLFSLTLFGLNAGVVFWGNSLRGYGLGSLLIILTGATMLVFLKRPTWLRAGIFLCSTILSVQALYQNTVLVAAICLGGWCVCWQRKDFQAAAKIFTAALMASISLLPYWNNIFGLSGANDPLRVGFSPYVALVNFDRLAAYPLPMFTYLWGLLAYVLLGFSVLALRAQFLKPQASSQKPRVDFLPVFAAVTMLAALAGFIVFLWFAGRQTQPWYYLPMAALMAMCFDVGIPLFLQPKWVRTAILGAAVTSALAATILAQINLNLRFTNVDGLAKQLNSQASPQDFVLVTPWFCGISFERYCSSNLAWQTVPPLSDHSVHRYDLLSDKMKSPNDALISLFDQMTATLKSGHRVWVISATNVGAIKIPADGKPRPPALPPPPLKYLGWSEEPYCANWAAQTAWFLKHNSVEFTGTNYATTAPNVSRYESMQLFVASGWKKLQTNPPVNSP